MKATLNYNIIIEVDIDGDCSEKELDQATIQHMEQSFPAGVDAVPIRVDKYCDFYVKRIDIEKNDISILQ